MMENVYLIDKDTGWTSFDVVAKIRGKLRAENPGQKIKVGHAGTLDPFATGLLIVLVGAATKKQDTFMKLDKEYEATLRLGATSTTGDPEGTITEIPNPKSQVPSEAEVVKVLARFTGEIDQIPPIYSALKIDGQRAYKLAREGKEVVLKSRKVTIGKIEIINYSYPTLSIRVACSSGTYIRSLAADIGQALGLGGYLTALRRTKIGQYSISEARKVNEIADLKSDNKPF